MSKWHGGKGDTPRKTDKKKFDDNWDRIFGSTKSSGNVFVDLGFSPEEEQLTKESDAIIEEKLGKLK